MKEQMKLLRTIFVFFCLFSSISWAKDSITELEKKLPVVSGKEKLEVLNSLSEAYWGESPKKIIEYGQQALLSAEELTDETEKARALNSIGVGYKFISDYETALKYCLKALNIRENSGDKKGIAESLHEVGIIYDYLNNYGKALEYYKRSLKIREEIGDKKGIAASLNNIGIIYHLTEEYEKALEYYQKSLSIRKELEDEKGIASCLNNVGVIYSIMKDYGKALKYCSKALEMVENMGNKYETANILNNIGSFYMAMQQYDESLSYLERSLKIAKELDAKEILRENYEFHSDLCVAKNDYKKALEYYKLSVKEKDSILNEKSSKQVADMQIKYESEKKEKEIELLKKDNKIKQLVINRQEVTRNYVIGGLIFFLILTFFIYSRYRLKKKANKELEAANKLIQLEKEKSDQLLLNILPKRIADILKENGKAEPESYENVTVFFSDIVSFTKMSNDLEPKILIRELNELFTKFDQIIEKNHCERIKTIGDAYLCVCGMPEANPCHAENILNSAIEIIRYLKKRQRCSNIQWEMRIGIHSGRVVGGVVGVKKYIYDVFGDTINTASRMETNSKPMKINISESTYQLVKDKYNFFERGFFSVKGKGEMKMYFVLEPEIENQDDDSSESEEWQQATGTYRLQLLTAKQQRKQCR